MTLIWKAGSILYWALVVLFGEKVHRSFIIDPVKKHRQMRSICIASVFGTCLGEEGSRVAWPFFPFSSSTETTTSGNTATYLSIETQLQNAHFLGRKMPPSCACRKSGDSDAECVQFDCSCLCDLTAGTSPESQGCPSNVCNLSLGMCDFNCCCDDECSQEQKNRFDVLNACIYEGQFDRELIKYLRSGFEY